jgi:hypothetical protein
LGLFLFSRNFAVKRRFSGAFFISPKGENDMSTKDWTGIPGSQYPLLMSKKRTKKRWQKQTIYEDKKYYYYRDPLHSEVEVYERQGNHVGVMTPEGDWHPKKGRDLEKSIRSILK